MGLDMQVPSERGMFFVLEGVEGCGKSLQARMLTEAMQGRGWPVLATHEPGGTRLGQHIRETLLLRDDFGILDPTTELFLFNASRRQLLSDVITPAILRGDNVVLDRYAVATLAYQGAGRGLGFRTILMAHDIMLTEADPRPDLCIIFDLPIEVGLGRKQFQGGQQVNRFELEAKMFHQRVRTAYHQIHQETQAGNLHMVKRTALVDANRPPELIHQDVMGLVEETLASRSSGANLPS